MSPDRVIRVALASDLHVEFDSQLLARRMSRRGGDPAALDAAIRKARGLDYEPNHPFKGPDWRAVRAADVDLVLMPGDLDVGVESVRYADMVARYLQKPTLISAGNHEHYRRDMLALLPELRAAAAATGGRVTFLECDRADLEVRDVKVAVLGATLWTDYKVQGDAALAQIDARGGLNDHRLIAYGRGARGRPKRFTPQHARQIHARTRAWLGREVPRARDEADVVIVTTHHAPLPHASGPRHEGSKLNPAFVSDMREEIFDLRPDAWFWGHTHHSMQEELDGVLLASAQRGYVGQEPGAEDFKPAVIEIPVRARAA